MPTSLPPLRPLISAARLRVRVSELAAAIERRYAGGEVRLLGVLRGARRFTEDLCRQLPGVGLPDWIQVASYGDATASSGEVRLIRDTTRDVRDRHVLITEDIVDSGRTAVWLLEHLRARGPASVKICSLLDKPSRRVVPVSPDFVGFTVPDAFFVGYGMAHGESHADLPYLAVLETPEEK